MAFISSGPLAVNLDWGARTSAYVIFTFLVGRAALEFQSFDPEVVARGECISMRQRL